MSFGSGALALHAQGSGVDPSMKKQNKTTSIVPGRKDKKDLKKQKKRNLILHGEQGRSLGPSSRGQKACYKILLVYGRSVTYSNKTSWGLEKWFSG